MKNNKNLLNSVKSIARRGAVSRIGCEAPRAAEAMIIIPRMTSMRTTAIAINKPSRNWFFSNKLPITKKGNNSSYNVSKEKGYNVISVLDKIEYYVNGCNKQKANNKPPKNPLTNLLNPFILVTELLNFLSFVILNFLNIFFFHKRPLILYNYQPLLILIK